MASKGNERYFNFPVTLLQGFLNDSRKCLNNIFDYSIYVKSLEYSDKRGFEWLESEDEIKAIGIAASFFRSKVGKKEKTFENGKMIYDSLPDGLPMVGLNLSIFWDYYKNEKTDFQKVTLLGYLGIKSILQNKAYCKTTNNYWLARMDGKVKAVKDHSELSSEIRKYANEYQTKKIKFELIQNWNLEHYSRYTRGFYVSLQLDLEQLIFEAEKRRKSTLIKQRKLTEELAMSRAMEKMKNQKMKHDHSTTYKKEF